jgi:hypothetical protein
MGLLIIKNHLSMQFCENSMDEMLMFAFVFLFKKQFSQEMFLELVGK